VLLAESLEHCQTVLLCYFCSMWTYFK